jgi:REP element-mobilizing transposase RayT
MLRKPVVTAPRQILPGKTYLLTRRCARREFLLPPTPVTRQVFGYVLAIAARRFGVRVHACCVMSNHVHLVVTDPDGRLPAFKQYLDSLVARALNAALGRWESFWAPGSYSAVMLAGPSDVVDKTAYTLANPVLAGLVRHGRKWRGLWAGPGQTDLGQLQFSRPKHFFRAEGAMPERATLALCTPPGFDEQAFRAEVAQALAAKERDAPGASAPHRGTQLRDDGARMQKPARRSSRGERRRGLAPRVACRDRWKRIEALGRLVAFLRDYGQALRAWRAGARSVVFPAGTYLMRLMHGVACAAPT